MGGKEKETRNRDGCRARSALSLAQKAINDAFIKAKVSWKLSNQQLSVNDFLSILQFDAIKTVAAWMSRGDCIVAQLCGTPCIDNSGEAEAPVWQQNEILLLSMYPLFIYKSFIERHPAILAGKDKNRELFCNLLKHYLIYISKFIPDKLSHQNECDIEQYADITKAMIGYILSTDEKAEWEEIIKKMHSDLTSDPENDVFYGYHAKPRDENHAISEEDEKIKRSCISLLDLSGGGSSSKDDLIFGCALIALIGGNRQMLVPPPVD